MKEKEANLAKERKKVTDLTKNNAKYREQIKNLQKAKDKANETAHSFKEQVCELLNFDVCHW